jgi:NodT family efflux transporter outer membrane factor (OMF) lipoprotein
MTGRRRRCIASIPKTENKRSSNIHTSLISRAISLSLIAVLVVGGCTVGPKYQKPTAQAPQAYKELTPADFSKTDGWKVAQPQDAALHGKWWEIFNDPELNTLEEQVNISNQNIKSASASYFAARALVKQARAQYYPTVSVGPSIATSRAGAAASTVITSGTSTFFEMPFDATWVPDLWGRVRNTVRAQASAAQASEADLENVRLTAQAEVAVDYYSLRGQDDLKQLLDSTVIAFQESLNLTKALYDTGIDSDESVAQAETQLESTQAQDTNLGILRAQFEHAIAMLVGQPPSTFSIPAEPLKSNPPAIPFGVPSQLLERRPDIAANERLMEQANAQIGIAVSAYYPTLTLSAAVGLESHSFTSWFTWPSRFFSVGPSLSETIYDGGLRKATVQQFRAQYDVTVANYRQTVLTAFQQVEDNLAALRLLSIEVQQEDAAVTSAQRTLKVATDRYKLGIDPYLNVLTAQTSLLSNEQTAVNLRIQQMTASVQLVEALGGGWDSSQLPTQKDVAQPPPPSPSATSNPPRQ